ncbi:MAG TPA: LPD38 domain-containing protein [Nitrosospira sp.]|nr:LPD38 domain-containing protein [Nitrosospira sp.]
MAETLLPDTDSGELVRPRTPRATRQRTWDLSDEDESRLDEIANTLTARRPTQTVPPKQEKPLGLMGTIREGAKGTLRALGATVDTMQGDAQGVVTAAQEQAAAPKDPDLERFYAHIEERKQALGEDPSIWEGIKAVGGAAIDNPRGFGLMVAEQLPNSGVALGAGAAGALAGSFAGPAGAVVGGLAGLAGANIGLETGNKALEAGADGTFTPDEQSRVRREGLVKGSVITGVDAATLGVTKFITGTTRRAVEHATTKILTDNGIDVTNAAARRAAMETPEIADAVKSAQELAKQGADKLGKTLARTGGAVALETIGEGAGEYLGELAATGKANAVDAVIEGFAGLGTSIGEIAATSALNRKGLKRLFDTKDEADKTAETETKESGIEHETIQHPTEPDKFAAVPKAQSVGGIELERDAEGNLKPVAPVTTQAEPEPATEDKAKDAPTIAGKPVTDMSNNALVYTANRGSERAQKVASAEIERRKTAGIDPSIANTPETPADAVKRIVATGAEKAQEDGKKAGVVLTTPKVEKAATATITPTPPAAKPKIVDVPIVSKPTSESAIETKKPETIKAAAPEQAVVPVKDVYGKTYYVRPSDLSNKEKTRIKIYRKDGSPVTSDNSRLHRENIDQDGTKAAEAWKDLPYIAGKNDKPFATKTAANVAIRKLKQDPIAFDIKPVNGGFVAVRKTSTENAKKDELKPAAPTPPTQASPTPKASAGAASSQETVDLVPPNSLRPHIESLIKRRAAASQSGKDRTVNNAIARAKEVMDGKRTDSARESKWFRAQAAVIRKVDPATADILSKISEAVKIAPRSATKDNAANATQEKKVSAPGVVRGDNKPVFQPRGGRILANGIAESIQKHGVSALVGKKITSPERLAELAQVYRNPQYETFRIFFTKGNTVVQASGVTSRMPGATPIFPNDMKTEQGVAWLKGMMESSGADGYWMLHNHPSGNPTPSNPDVEVTKQLAQMLPGMKGHVIINSNKYSQIMLSGRGVSAKVITKQFGEDQLLKASKPSEYIGKPVQSPEAAALIGKSFQKEGWVTLIGISGVSGVRAIAEIPTTTFTHPGLAKAAIRRFARRTGSGSIFAYGSAADLTAGKANELVREGFLRDAVDDKGLPRVAVNRGKSFGKVPGTGGLEVQQDTAAFSKATAPIRDRLDKITDSLIYNFQDRFKPLKDIQQRAGPVAEDEDAALAEERYSGRVRARSDAFEEQLRDPLLKAIHDSGVSFEDVEEYLHALHAPSRNAAMREINPTVQELDTRIKSLAATRDKLAKDTRVIEFIQKRRELRQMELDVEDGIADAGDAAALRSEVNALQREQTVKDYTKTIDSLKASRATKPFDGDNTALSGMSDTKAAAILAKIDGNGTRKALEKVSAIVDTITSRTRQIYIESGLEKADAIEAWDKKYEHYIPLHRDEVSGNTMPRVGQGFNIRGKESKRATGSTKEVTNILAHVVAQHEAAIVRSEKARVDRTLFQFAVMHPDPSLWTLDAAPKIKTVDPTSGFVVERVDPTYKNRPEVLTLKIDGEEHTITFNEQNQEAMRLAASMKNLSSEQLGEVTQMVGKITRFLATMNTTMNPVFVARNFMRDLQTAFVNLSDTELAAKKKEVFRDVPAAIKGMWNMDRGNHKSEWAKHAAEFKAAGGQTGWMEHYKDIGDRANNLKKELDAMKPGKWNFTRQQGRKWLDLIQDANNAVENGTRLSAYVNARRSGMSQGKAAQMAKNLTVNFNTRGAKSTELNMWYMFMNASIQGSARLIKALSNKQVRKIVAGVVLTGFLMDVLARSFSGDDDEDGQNDYDQLPEHTKAMNFVFMVDNRPVTIPMPYGYNFFASAGRKISEMMFRENHSAAKSAVELGAVFLDAFSPTGQAGSALQYAAPTVADPFVQWSENRNFAGNPLRRAQNPFGVPNPEYQMGFKSTSAPAKWLAEVLNNETGGNEVRPGYVDVNPAMFDFMVSSIAGGAGRTYTQVVSGPMKLAGDDDVQAREVPFLNIFVGAKPEHQTERKYFEAAKKVELAAKELKTYREKGDIEMARQIRDEHKEELRLVEAAKNTKNILAHLRKRDLALDKIDAPNKRELRKAIEEKKREVMSRFNKQYIKAVTAEQ